MGKNLILGAAIGALAIAYGCAGSGSGGTTAYAVEDFEYPLTSTNTAAGQELYAEFCEGCHPGGEEGDGPKISDAMASPAQMRWKVRSGGDDMPAFGPDKISKAQLDDLLAFTETFGAIKR